MVDQIRERLSEALKPVHLEVADESHMHNVPSGAESHFNVFVVSEAFAFGAVQPTPSNALSSW